MSDTTDNPTPPSTAAPSPAKATAARAGATRGRATKATATKATATKATASKATASRAATKAPAKAGAGKATAASKATSSNATPVDDDPVLQVGRRRLRASKLIDENARLREELASRKRSETTASRKARLENRLKPFQVELLKLQKHLEDHQRRMIVLFEGRDAAGKGGTIRRVTRYMNEKHYRVVALGKPTEEQRSQWYFQRYVAQFPHGGEMVLFDRSWYNRAMVEPVFDFCTEEEYRNFMRGVVGFEKDLVRQGTVLVKLYFSVTKAEQKRRFDRRRDDPLRQWKLSEIDMQAQEHWDDFTDMKFRMLKRTSTTDAPWTIIRSESKPDARLNAMKVILNAVNYENRNTDLDFVPDPVVVVSAAQEQAMLEAERIRSGRFSG
jgi:polyphosphate kinase 2